MITPLECGLAAVAISVIIFFALLCTETESVDDKGCGCCLAVVVILAAVVYLVYFAIRVICTTILA